MKYSRTVGWWLRWIFAPLCFLPAVFFGLAAIITFFNADNWAARSQAVRAALLIRADYVESTRSTSGRLPAPHEFEKASKAMGGFWSSGIFLHVSRPEAQDGFDFPPWPAGEHFGISLWRGEWNDYYDSATKRTTVDRSATAAFWRRNSLHPTFWSVAFAGLGCLVYFLGRKIAAVMAQREHLS